MTNLARYGCNRGISTEGRAPARLQARSRRDEPFWLQRPFSNAAGTERRRKTSMRRASWFGALAWAPIPTTRPIVIWTRLRTRTLGSNQQR